MTSSRSLAVVIVIGCGSSAVAPVGPDRAKFPLSIAADERMITVPAGQFIAGSTPEERAGAYDDFLHTANHDGAREHAWFAKEADRHAEKLPAFMIDLMPVTQSAYAEFVSSGAAPAPAIDEAGWKAQGFQQDYATQVVRFLWKDGRPPHGREDHPVVLITHDEATRYCGWRGRRLPTAAEFEKGARGDQGLAYPWGNAYEATKLNSAVGGPGDTTPVGTYGDGASPYGLFDMAGNVFQWTSTPGDGHKMTVKGSAWDDYGGVGRGASQHARKHDVRHVIVGFRCASDVR